MLRNFGPFFIIGIAITMTHSFSFASEKAKKPKEELSWNEIMKRKLEKKNPDQGVNPQLRSLTGIPTDQNISLKNAIEEGKQKSSTNYDIHNLRNYNVHHSSTQPPHPLQPYTPNQNLTPPYPTPQLHPSP